MALWDVEVRGRRTHELVDWARNLTYEEALDVVEEMERIWQDDPTYIRMERAD